MRWRNRLAWLLAPAALAAGCAGTGVAPAPGERPAMDEAAAVPERVVLVSIAGFAPSRYRSVAGAAPDMPRLAALAAVSADAVRPVAPASRYPAHATLVTGRRPAGHGIVADRRLGDRGVEPSRYREAEQLRAPALWTLASAAGLRVAALGWPSTLGAPIAALAPDLEPRGDESWLAALARGTRPEMLALLADAGAAAPEVRLPGAARDAVLLDVACRMLGASEPPNLLLLHLDSTVPALVRHGVDAPETSAAFGAADAAIADLVDCVRRAGRLATTAFFVVGDHGVAPLHTVVAPNVVLAEAGLLTPSRRSGGIAASAELVSWSAIARSNGGSAFVYARGAEDAVLARRALEAAASRSRAFRVVTADEMLGLGADPDAWFGLEAKPGFGLTDSARPPFQRQAVARSGAGYLPGWPPMDAGLVAFGAGLRRELRVPEMEQTDVAPTLGRLLGLEIPEADGRVLVGVLRPAPVVAEGVEEGP